MTPLRRAKPCTASGATSSLLVMLTTRPGNFFCSTCKLYRPYHRISPGPQIQTVWKRIKPANECKAARLAGPSLPVRSFTRCQRLQGLRSQILCYESVGPRSSQAPSDNISLGWRHGRGTRYSLLDEGAKSLKSRVLPMHSWLAGQC